MKLVVQIPCFNEEETVLEVINSIPKKIKGIDEIKIFLIDDGSKDKTVAISEPFVDKIILIKKNSGLANAFKIGVKEALKEKADILVNIDGDNQYNALDIEKLIQPIINHKADITIGTRPIDKIKEFNKTKKNLQKIGTMFAKLIANIHVKDAASGFRAFNSKAMLNLNIFNSYTYTLETLIQANIKNLAIENVEIGVNRQKNRKSKLVKNNLYYITRQAYTLIRFFIIYRANLFFSFLSAIFFIIGIILGSRYLYFYFNNDGTGHIQSLILCAIILILSFILSMLAIVGDLLSINRKLLEDIQLQLRQNEYKK